MKKFPVVLMLILLAACSRELSSGSITVNVVLETQDQFAMPATTEVEEAEDEVLDTRVFLLDNEIRLADLREVQEDWRQSALSVEGSAVFERTEGMYTVAVDADNNGRIDAFARDVPSGAVTTIVVSGLNVSDDGSFLVVDLDKLAYSPGETMELQVSGFVPSPVSVAVEIWNARNGGFVFWTSAYRDVSEEVAFTETLELPPNWPPSSEESGSEYFARAITANNIYPGTPFILLDDGSFGGDSDAPENGVINIDDGAPATPDRQVEISFSVDNAVFIRLANVEANLETANWINFQSLDAEALDWILASGADGQRTVYAQFANNLGALSEVTLDTILLDTTPPVLSDIQVMPPVAGTGVEVTVSFDVNEPVTGAVVWIGDRLADAVSCAAMSCTATYDVVGDEVEGDVDIMLSAYDLVGLVGSAETEVRFDFTPPQTIWAAGRPSDPDNVTMPVFDFDSSELNSTFECNLNGGGFVACPKLWAPTLSVDGPQTVAVRAVDAAGNRDLSPLMHAWHLDTTVPTTTILSAPPALTNSSVAEFMFIADEPVTFRCRVNSQPFSQCSSPASYGGFGNGEHTFEIYALDAAGNIEAPPQQVTWAVDFTPPFISPLDITPRVAADGVTIVIEFEVNKVIGTPEVTIGGNPATLFATAGSTYTFTYDVSSAVDIEGNAQVLVTVVDTAGNDAILTDLVRFDFTPPQTFFAGPKPPTPTSDTTFDIDLLANEFPATFECRLNAVTWTTCPESQTLGPLADGNYDFEARAVDAAGNVDPSPVFASWQVDTSAPTTIILSQPPALTNSSIGRITFTATETATFRCQLLSSGAGFTGCNSPATYGGLAGGVQTFFVYAIDTAGNIEPVSHPVTWTVDHTPSTISSLVAVPAYAGAGSNVTITFSLSESAPTNPVVTVADRPASIVAVTGNSYIYSYTVTGSEPEGQVDVRVRARDLAGNLSQKTTIITLDFTPPQTFFAGPLPPPITNSTNEIFPLVASDPFAAFQCSLDGGAYAPCPASASVVALTDAAHTFRARAVDRAGNVDPTPVQHTWTVDTGPPMTIITSSPPPFTNSSIARVEYIATEPATFECNMLVYGIGFSICSSPSTYGGLDEGEHTLYIVATDPAGNVEPVSAQVSWIVDFTNPKAHSLTITPRYARAGVTVDISFTVDDWSLDDPLPEVTISAFSVTDYAVTDYTLVGNTYTFSHFVTGGEPEGPADVRVEVRDAATNLRVLDGQMEFDFTPPDTLGGELPPVITQGPYGLTISSNEPGGHIEGSIDGGPFVTNVTDYFVPVDGVEHQYLVGDDSFSDGIHWVQFRAVDRAGNVDPSPVTEVFEVDTIPPPPPDASKLDVLGAPSGSQDQLQGQAGAVDASDTTSVRVYSDAALASLAGEGFAISPDGSFFAFPIGDNLSDGSDRMYVTAVDAAGNESTSVFVINPKQDPEITPLLILIQIINNAGHPDYANETDILRIRWINASFGDNIPYLESVYTRIPGSGLPTVEMSDIGGGVYQGDVLVSGVSIDDTYPAEVSARNIVGVESGWVSSFPFATVTIDTILPAAPGNVTSYSDGVSLYVSWNLSASVDVTFEVPGRSDAPIVDFFNDAILMQLAAPQLATAAIEPCSTHYGGVVAIDDAGNLSPVGVTGPLFVPVPVPSFTAWGTVSGGFAYAESKNPFVEQVEYHYGPVSGAPYAGTTLTGGVSPITTTIANTTRISPLLRARDYYAAARAKHSTCLSDYSRELSFHTLTFVGVGGSISEGGVCEGDCGEVGSEGQSFFGGLGFSLAAVGDLHNNDGVEDLIVGAPGDQTVVLLSGSSLTQVTALADYKISMDIFGGGPSLISGLDLDADGVTDYVVGSPLETIGGQILAGAVRGYDATDNTELWEVTGVVRAAQAGYALARVGDLNGDGADDVLIGAFGCLTAACTDPGGGYSSAGQAFVVSGTDGTQLYHHPGTEGGSYYGVAVAGGVDLNGDTIPDYVIGAPGPLVQGEPFDGFIEIRSGADGSLLSTVRLSDAVPGFQQRFGASVEVVADLGGAPAVIVGAPSPVAGASGFVYVHRFLDDPLILQKPGSLSAQTFGTAVRVIGDFDGDGIQNLVVGAPNFPFGSAFGGGNAYIYGLDTGDIRYQISGGSFDGAIGYGFTAVGDRNGDNNPELAVGAPGSIGDGLYGAGRVYFLTVTGP